MQFLSQSMGWADCIIVAVAPLGIITTIVSAIRIGGPSWLRAVIGRSTENLSAAEMDLMSSTSKETCELWNGDDVVRCQGEGSVEEFVCLFPKDVGHNSTVKIMTLNQAMKVGIIESVGGSSSLGLRVFKDTDTGYRHQALKGTPPVDPVYAGGDFKYLQSYVGKTGRAKSRPGSTRCTEDNATRHGRNRRATNNHPTEHGRCGAKYQIESS